MQRRPRQYRLAKGFTHPEGRPGDAYTKDEIEFMMTMDRLQRKWGVKIKADDPLVLSIIKSLGYRR